MTNLPFLIAFVGIDGCGKSSTVARIASEPFVKNTVFTKKEKRDNVNRIIHYYPNEHEDFNQYMNSDFASYIRWAHAFDFLRYYQNNVHSILAKGTSVISDRWFYCSVAYAYAGTDQGPLIEKMLRVIQVPDLIIYLDVHPQIAFERISKRGDLKTDEGLDTLRAYKKAYDKILGDSNLPVHRIENIDFEKTYAKVKNLIEPYFSSTGS